MSTHEELTDLSRGDPSTEAVTTGNRGSIPVLSLFLHTGDINTVFGGNLLESDRVRNWYPFLHEARDHAHTLQTSANAADHIIDLITQDEDAVDEESLLVRNGLIADLNATKDTLGKLVTMHGGETAVSEHGFFVASDSPEDHAQISFLLEGSKKLGADTQRIRTDHARGLMNTLTSVLACLDPEGGDTKLTEEMQSYLEADRTMKKTFNGDVRAFAKSLVRTHQRIQDVYTEAAGEGASMLSPLSAFHQRLVTRLDMSIGERELETLHRAEEQETVSGAATPRPSGSLPDEN